MILYDIIIITTKSTRGVAIGFLFLTSSINDERRSRSLIVGRFISGSRDVSVRPGIRDSLLHAQDSVIRIRDVLLFVSVHCLYVYVLGVYKLVPSKKKNDLVYELLILGLSFDDVPRISQRFRIVF